MWVVSAALVHAHLLCDMAGRLCMANLVSALLDNSCLPVWH